VIHEDLQLRVDEAQRVGYGFGLPAANTVSVVPIVPKEDVILSIPLSPDQASQFWFSSELDIHPLAWR
jgi:hypothetical protein